MSRCIKVDTLGRLCDDDLGRLYNHFITTNVYLIGAMYNSYFLIIYKPSSLIISPQTFNMQLGAGTAWFCLSQCAISFCTLSTGQIPHMGFEPRQNFSSLEMVNKFTKRMESTTEEAKSVIRKAQKDITRYYNQRRSLVPVFKLGDRVYLDASDIKTTCLSPKLSHCRLGPFEIEC